MWMPGANCAVNNQNRQVICCGSVLLQETYGPYVQGKSKNAQMKPMISSCCSKRWYRDSLQRNQKNGQWYLGEFGMHGIKYTLREFNPTPKPSWQGLLGSCRNTKTSPTHKGTMDKLIRGLVSKMNWSTQAAIPLQPWTFVSAVFRLALILVLEVKLFPYFRCA